jgi:hypothetical protein
MLHQSRYKACAALLVLVGVLADTASAGLVGYWKLDEGAGTTAKDSSGKGNNGTLNGGAKWVTGKIGGAVQFNGSDAYIRAPHIPLDNRSFTITMWINPVLTGSGVVFSQAQSGSTNLSMHFRLGGPSSTDAPVRGIRMGFYSNDLDSPAGLLQDNTWYHLTFWYDASTQSRRIYVDGVLQAEQTAGVAPYRGTSGDTIIGNWETGAQWYQGIVDDVHVFDRALTDEQLQDLIVNNVSPIWPKAEGPAPVDGATGIVLPLLTWTKGDDAVLHNVYVGTEPNLTAANLVGPRYQSTTFYYTGGMVPGTTYYLAPEVTYWWRVDEVGQDGTICTGDVWKFTAAPLMAYAPNPRSGDKWIATDAALSWQPGMGATQHKVYFSTDKDAVVNRDASAFQVKQAAFSFEPDALELNTTYYWAVDEVGVTTEEPGELWKFTTVGAVVGGVKGEYYNGTTPSGAPQLSRIDPEINFNWGDPGGPGAPIGVDGFSARWTADLEIAIADNYTFITSSDDGVRLWLNDELVIDNWTDHATADNYSLPMSLEPGVYSLRMEYYENLGGAVAQLSWQSPNFVRQIIPSGPLQPPVRARALYPQSGDVNLPQDLTLMWGAGEKAVKHQIYFGDDADAVAAADPSSNLYQGEQTLDETTFTPGQLEWNRTYWWRIDEVNEAAPESLWVGSVWSFTTADFLVVDDFETYNDEEGTDTRIYETWIDGYTDGLSGSTVGNLDPPFAEQTIVHGGKQAMPMDYNNISSPYFSRAYREFAPLQNWTVNGLSDLVLWVRGNPAPVAPVTESGGQMTVSGEGADIWGVADEFTFVYKTLNGDGAISARVTSNGTGSNAWAKGGVMIRDSLAAGSAHAAAVMTGGSGGGNGGSFQYRLMADSDSASSDAAAVIAPPYYVKVERKGDTLTASFSPDGTNWTVQGDPQYVVMMSPAYVGVCVSSHTPGEFRTFEFDKITVTGASGTWQTKEIGLARNSVQPLYVIVEDSTGHQATVVDPNEAAVNAAQWTEWKIPLTDLAGVSLNKVERLYIGVGDPQNAAPDGYGRVYIDDIRVMKPAPAAPPEE